MISDRAKRLVLALHEPFSNEARWQLADWFLEEEAREAVQNAHDSEWVARRFTRPWYPVDFGPTHDDVSGRIAQTLGQNEEGE